METLIKLLPLITACFALIGYFYNSSQNRSMKKFELKAEAYAQFLKKIELLLPDKDGDKLIDNNKIRELNEIITVLLIYAPDQVVKQINIVASSGKIDRAKIRSIQFILHGDIHHPIVNWFKPFLYGIKEQDFPYFTFQQNKN